MVWPTYDHFSYHFLAIFPTSSTFRVELLWTKNVILDGDDGGSDGDGGGCGDSSGGSVGGGGGGECWW